MTDQPGWYDDLGGTLDNALRELSNAVTERGHGFRTLSVASIGADGAPRSRIVVLRGVEAGDWTLRFHSDLRSDKIAEFDRDDRVSLLFYDKDRKLQVRCSGRARAHRVDGEADDRGVAKTAFEASQPMSRVCYRVEPGPGTKLSKPSGYEHAEVSNSQDGDVEVDPGAENFAAVMVACDEVEVLYLARKGHRRSRFRRGGDGAILSDWLTP